MKRIRAVVSGQVQGVGYRDFVRRRAEEAGLTGWVANRPDGSVECVAEGGDEALRELIAELWKGPMLGRVDRVEVNEEEKPEGLTGFRLNW